METNETLTKLHQNPALELNIVALHPLPPKNLFKSLMDLFERCTGEISSVLFRPGLPQSQQFALKNRVWRYFFWKYHSSSSIKGGKGGSIDQVFCSLRRENCWTTFNTPVPVLPSSLHHGHKSIEDKLLKGRFTKKPLSSTPPPSKGLEINILCSSFASDFLGKKMSLQN